jgi:N-acetyl-gamma-glutamyl-phosphate reductase
MGTVLAMNGISQNGNGQGRKPRVLVAGALGAVGSLVADLIDSHPNFELAALTARDTGDSKSPIGKTLFEIYPEHRVDVVIQTLDDVNLDEFDAAVVAYPTGAAARLARQLREMDVVVVDSCADFRFAKASTYEEWYDSHEAPSLIDEAVYGLPELNREKLLGAKLIGNPGCYPTASVLALAPLAQAGLVADVVIDAKSGVSGAGKRGDKTPPFVGTHDSMRPYGVPKHRHKPEIVEQLSELGYEGNLSFVPHLVPIDQGELVSCYVTPAREIDTKELHDLYEAAYRNEPFVEVTPELPTTRDVQRTNICRIHPAIDHGGGRVLVFAAIDNLWKGGASQAIQNLNLALGMPEETGISDRVAFPTASSNAPSLDRPPVSA